MNYHELLEAQEDAAALLSLGHEIARALDNSRAECERLKDATDAASFKEGIAAERERCAKVADEAYRKGHAGAFQIAKRIREGA